MNRYALGGFGIGETALEDFSHWGMHVERMALLPYSADSGNRNASPDASCEQFRAGRLSFMFLGALCHRKGVDVLLRAFARVVGKERTAALVLVGDDRSQDAYSRQAATLGIQDLVQFRGPVNPKDLSSVLRCADVLVLPSRFDGWGVVLNEGASMGLALIGSDRAGHHATLLSLVRMVSVSGREAFLLWQQPCKRTALSDCWLANTVPTH